MTFAQVRAVPLGCTILQDVGKETNNDDVKNNTDDIANRISKARAALKSERKEASAAAKAAAQEENAIAKDNRWHAESQYSLTYRMR